jgi:hypothetical protein
MDRVQGHSENDTAIENDKISDGEYPDDEELVNEGTSIISSGNTNYNIIMHQLEGNDINLKSLEVVGQDYYPPNGDWAGLGRAMGRNSHLKELCVSGRTPMVYIRDLFSGIASN